MSSGCAEAMTAKATHGRIAASSRARVLSAMRLNEKPRRGGGFGMHFSHFPRTCPEQVLMAQDYTTHVNGSRAGFPKRIEKRGLLATGLLDTFNRRYRMHCDSASGSDPARRQRGTAGE